MSRQRRVVVLGGGIAGLAAAYRLSRSAPALAVTLVEAGPRLGGKILTERPDGLVIEAGPDSFLSAKPAATRLCEELGLGGELVGTTESGGGTYILRDGRLEPLPEGISGLVPTRVRPLLRSGLLSTRAKLRMGLEVVVPARRDEGDESVAAFVRRRFGGEAYERMAQPLLSGIYAGDAEQLSLLATFPRLRESERTHGSLIRGMLAQRRAAPKPPSGSAPPRSAFLSLAGGLGELTETLAGALDRVEVRSGVAATAVAWRGSGGWTLRLANGDVLEADALLLATPAWASADLLQELSAPLAATLRQIPYTSTATITAAYRSPDIAGLGAGRGFVIPRVEDRELTAVTWVTSKFPGRAPQGVALVRGFVGRAGREAAVDLADDDLVALVRRELREILGLTAEPFLARVYRWPRALPQYTLGHLERVATIDRHVAQLPGLYLLGSAYRGVGIPDCIQSGSDAATRALDHLGIEGAGGLAG